MKTTSDQHWPTLQPSPKTSSIRFAREAMRFLADAGVSPKTVTYLSEAGHDIVHVRALAMQRAPDHAILGRARSEQRIVITFDLDFGDLLALGGAEGPRVGCCLSGRPSARRYTWRMAQPTVPPPGFDDLSADEKLEYVQALWDHLSEHPEEVPVADWHREIVAERLAAHRRGDTTSRPWPEVREELLDRLRTAR